MFCCLEQEHSLFLVIIRWKFCFAEDAFNLYQVFEKTLASVTPVRVVVVTTLLIMYFGTVAKSKHWTVVRNLRGATNVNLLITQSLNISPINI